MCENKDQASCTGTWKECCEYFKRCIGPDGALDARVVIGVNAFAEWEYGHVAANKQECERDINSAINGGPPGAGGTWEEGCGNKNEPTNCNDVSGIPDELADIVFGKRIGNCDVSSGGSTTTTPETKEDCDTKGGTWTQRKIGNYDERTSPYIKVAKGIGQSADRDVEVLFGIKDGQQDLSVIQDAINDEMAKVRIAFLALVDACCALGSPASSRVCRAGSERQTATVLLRSWCPHEWPFRSS